MARRSAGRDLQHMYTTSTPRVRDQPAAYGPHEVEGDEFPAARVLLDLTHASDADVPRILARYAALRSWLLRQDGADPTLVSHAAHTARAYLQAVEDWPGTETLARLADPEPALDWARRAAEIAEEGGHVEGAYALLRAAYTVARQRCDMPSAARSATAIADLLDRERTDGVALWRRRARQLRRYADER